MANIVSDIVPYCLIRLICSMICNMLAFDNGGLFNLGFFFLFSWIPGFLASWLLASWLLGFLAFGFLAFGFLAFGFWLLGFLAFGFWLL